MFSTLIGDPSYVREKTSTYKDLFSTICSEGVGADEGCALFAIDFYGGQDRTLSIYEYQVSTQSSIFW